MYPIVADGADQLGQHVIGFEKAFRARPFVGELGGRLLPGAVDFAEHVIIRDEEVGENHLVEFKLPGDLPDRVHLDARLFHLDEELRQAVAAVLFGRR